MLGFVYLLLIAHAKASYDIRNKSFVFISGHPQSGTSLLMQLLDTSSIVSTMISGCLAKGKPILCRKKNSEGQWLITPRSNTSDLLQPGQMIPISMTAAKREALLATKDRWLTEWFSYWDSSRAFLVEKSPHSMLKSALYNDLFEGAKSIKFIIVLKHPVTLNCAIIKKETTAPTMTWTTTNWRPSKPQTIKRNIDHYIAMMRGNSTKSRGASFGGISSLGWLDAHRELHRQLVEAAQRKSQQHFNIDFGIVYFEDFARPLDLCMRLMLFVFGNDKTALQNINKEVCYNHFLFKHNRQLSLKAKNYGSLQFYPDLVAEESRSRSTEFRAVYDGASTADQETLKAINDELVQFGYDSLRPCPDCRISPGAFDDWDLLKRVDGHVNKL